MKRFILFLITLALLASCLMLPSHAASAFEVKKAIRISPTEIVIELSAQMKDDGFNSAFIGLRRMVMKSNKPSKLAFNGGIPLQDGCVSWRFWSETDHSRVICTFDERAIDAMLDTNHEYYQKGYRSYLCIEEKNPPSGHSHKTLQGVKAKDGTELSATLPGVGGAWDGVYVKITTDYSYGLEIPEDPTVTLPAGAETDADTTPTTEAPAASSGCAGTLGAGALILALSGVALSFGKRR